jgi:F-type H+-transporting ATPase subunit b
MLSVNIAQPLLFTLAAAAEGDQPSLLAPDLGSAVWSIVLFGLLLLVLGKFVWPPILKGLQDREQRIRNDLDEAAKANKDAKETLAQYESQLAEAQAESRKLIEQARKDADDLRSRMTSETEQQIAQMRQRATEEIRLAKQEAVQDLYAQTAQLATAVAGRILQRQINADDADRLVEQSVKELEDRRAG